MRVAAETALTQGVSSPKRVREAEPGDIVTLLAGMNEARRDNIRDHRTVGGVQPNVAAQPPHEADIRSHVGGSQPGRTAREHLCEFTTDPTVARGFARGNGFLVKVGIERKYLASGSTSEGGWVCTRDAPVRLLGSVPMGSGEGPPLPDGLDAS